MEARGRLGGKFETLEQFFEEVDLKRVNKKAVEALIKAGAFDNFGYNRNELITGFPKFIERADGARHEKEIGQTSLFDLGGAALAEDNRVKMDRLEPWTRALTLSNEKEVLGFYLTDHPLRGLEVVAKVWGAQMVENLHKLENKTKIHVLGLVATCREIITKKGTRMAFVRFEDGTGNLEMIVFPDTFAAGERVLKSDAPILVSGTLEKEDGGIKIIAEQMRAADDLFKQIKKITLDLKPEMTGKMAELREWMEKHPGEAALTLRLHLPQAQVEMEIKDFKGIRASSDALDGLLRLGIPMGLH